MEDINLMMMSYVNRIYLKIVKILNKTQAISYINLLYACLILKSGTDMPVPENVMGENM